MALALSRRFAASLRVRPETLNVAPALLGAPLAPHGRRMAAMAVDLLVVGILSKTGEFWIAAGIGALVWQLRHRPPAGSRWRAAWLWFALAALVFVGAQRAIDFTERQLAPSGAAASARADATDDDDAAPSRALAGARAAAPGASSQAEAASLEQAVRLLEAQAAARIHRLEAELAEARKPQLVRWHDQFVKSLQGAVRGLGWTVAYFTLLPFWWKGQTVGKRLLGLRVVELTGRPLGPMTTFSRYGGYAAGMATGGAGFLQVLWDANRQGIQDKVAHTVVIDLRAPRDAAPADATRASAVDGDDPLAADRSAM